MALLHPCRSWLSLACCANAGRSDIISCPMASRLADFRMLTSAGPITGDQPFLEIEKPECCPGNNGHVEAHPCPHSPELGR
jgi:hypothetical protein